MIERKRNRKEWMRRVVGEKMGRKIGVEKAFISRLAKFPLDGSNIPGIRSISVLGKG